MKSLLYQFIGLSYFFAMTSCMLSDTYEARFGTGLVRRTLTNLQNFKGALGGALATPISDSGDPSRPFLVGDSTYPDLPTAGTNSCSQQFNTCQLIANNGTGSFSVSDCTNQQNDCNSAQSTSTTTSFEVLVSQDANFDYICDTADDQ